MVGHKKKTPLVPKKDVFETKTNLVGEAKEAKPLVLLKK